jgi:cystathionine beta-synthase
VGSQDVLATAYSRLRNNGISQLPVLEDDALVGMLTEKDIIRYVYGKPERMNAKVGQAMQTSFPVVEKSMPIDHLAAHLGDEPYMAVMDGCRFLGLITRADMLNYLRKQPSGEGNQNETI